MYLIVNGPTHFHETPPDSCMHSIQAHKEHVCIWHFGRPLPFPSINQGILRTPIALQVQLQIHRGPGLIDPPWPTSLQWVASRSGDLPTPVIYVKQRKFAVRVFLMSARSCHTKSIFQATVPKCLGTFAQTVGHLWAYSLILWTLEPILPFARDPNAHILCPLQKRYVYDGIISWFLNPSQNSSEEERHGSVRAWLVSSCTP